MLVHRMVTILFDAGGARASSTRSPCLAQAAAAGDALGFRHTGYPSPSPLASPLAPLGSYPANFPQQ